jgi:hypothetical protein
MMAGYINMQQYSAEFGQFPSLQDAFASFLNVLAINAGANTGSYQPAVGDDVVNGIDGDDGDDDEDGGDGGANTAPNPAQTKCIKNATITYNTQMIRNIQDGNRSWGHTIVNFTVGGAVGGCIGGLVVTGGVGCPLLGVLSGAAGFLAGTAYGLWDSLGNLQVANARAQEDYQSQIQLCLAGG